jgi:hypothetical protein
MTARVLYADPDQRSHGLLEMLRRDGVECIELRNDLKDILDFMLVGKDILLVSADELVKMPMVAAASSLMQVVAYIPPMVEGTHWVTLPGGVTSQQHAELVMGLIQDGDEGRRRTRIPLQCRLWIKGVAHTVENASVRELWLSSWCPTDDQTLFDGVLDLGAEYGCVKVAGQVVARRDNGCAVHVSPTQDMGLLSWLDYFSQVLNRTPESKRIELVKEYFDET